jgi:uracil-DNA glycosylase
MRRSDLLVQLRERVAFLDESGVYGLSSLPSFAPASQSFVSSLASTGPAPVVRSEDPERDLADLRVEIGDCTRCRLCEKRTQVVFGVGNPQADLMFVGEGPGYEEDRQGMPFVGKAGQLLNRIIQAMEMTRDQVYIANVVKCRPPENRTPMPDEISICSPFLFRQISIIRPRIVCALGGVAVQTLLQTSTSVSRLRGELRSLPDGTPVMPTFHPAYLLRNPEKKKEVWEDMKKVMEYLSRAPRS